MQTVEDLESVDASSVSSPEAWDETLAAARERVDVNRARAEALESGDADALEETYSQRPDHPFADWQTLGLTNRSCAGLRF